MFISYQMHALHMYMYIYVNCWDWNDHVDKPQVNIVCSPLMTANLQMLIQYFCEGSGSKLSLCRMKSSRVMTLCSCNNALNKGNWTQEHVDASACGVTGSDSHGKILLYFVLYNSLLIYNFYVCQLSSHPSPPPHIRP